MAGPKHDRDFWEELWARTLREQPEKVARRGPSSFLVGEAAGLLPGRGLDARCGHGAETLWLAAQGWRVTAVDFSAAALGQGRAMAERAGRGIAERIEWVEGDLACWSPEAGAYDLVVSLYVHVAGSVEERVRRLAGCRK